MPEAEAGRDRPNAEPLPADIVARYAADGLDVSGLTAEDAGLLRTLEGLPFKNNDERLKELREMIGYAVENRRENAADRPMPTTAEEAEETAALAEAAKTDVESGTDKVVPLRAATPREAIFDPEAELRRLLEKRRQTMEEIGGLPETAQSAAHETARRDFKEKLEGFKGDLLEQRRGMGAILEAVREVVLSSIETQAGPRLGEMIELADKATDPNSPDEALAAQKKLNQLRGKLTWANVKRAEWWKSGLPLEEVMSPKSARLVQEHLLDAVKTGADQARLTPEQRGVFDDLAVKVIERRQAIAVAREQAPTPEALYRFCFGREPLGKVSVLEGPITIYFRCENIEDYTLIFSQNFSNGEVKVSDEDRKMAKKTGGVSISATRAYAPNLEQDPDLIDQDGIPDRDKTEARRQLLIRLRGAIIAENNSVPRKFLDRWRVYRHEEQHAFKKIVGEFALDQRGKKSAETLRGVEDAEAAHEAMVKRILATVMRADEVRGKGGDPEKELQQLRQEVGVLEHRQDEAEASLHEEISAYTMDWIESAAKDEILAYYLEGRLPEAVEIYDLNIIGPEPADPDEPLQAELKEPYLKEPRAAGGIYDYHANPAATEWVLSGVVREAAVQEAMAKFRAEQTGTTAEKKTDADDELSRQADAAVAAMKDDRRREALRPLVRAAMAEHQTRYHQTLDMARQAIETLESSGMNKQEIMDILALEPLKGWPRLAARLAGNRGQGLVSRTGQKKKVA